MSRISSKTSNTKRRTVRKDPEEKYEGGSLIAEVRASQQYLKFKKVVTVINGRLTIDQFRNEALNLHSTRTTRELYGKKQYSAKSIMDAILKDASVRSRLVELRVQVDIQNSLLHEACKSISHYIKTEFKDEMRSYSTNELKSAFVNRILKSANELHNDASSFLSIVDQIIKDIDQTNYALQHVVNTMKLLDGAKGGQVV